MTEEKKKILRDLFKALMETDDRKQRVEECRIFCGKVSDFVKNANPTAVEKKWFYDNVVSAIKNGVAGAKSLASSWQGREKLTYSELSDVFSDMFSVAKSGSDLDSGRYNEFKEKFYQVLRLNGDKEQPFVFNRIIAAVFPKLVLSIPSEKRKGFTCLYNWFKRSGLLDGSSDLKRPSWYDMNRMVMKSLDLAFEDCSEPVNEFQKWAFAGDLWTKIKDGSKAGDDLMGILKDGVINKSTKEVDVVHRLVEMVAKSHNVVLTGAPGTGKTYLARQVARAMVLSEKEKKLPKEEIEELIKSRTSFVQFHPSYDYTDFVEGLRPIQGPEGDVGFKRQDGEFKALCKRAIAADRSGGGDNFDEVWEKFIADLEERHSPDNPLELITPETNSAFKVFANRRGNLSLITSGTEKVQGSLTKANIRKTYESQQDYDYWMGYFKGVISYLLDAKNGYGLKPYEAGKSVAPDSQQKFVIIIDEINRGDISKIFGELFYAIDLGYRGEAGRVKTQYQNLVEKTDPFYGGFYVPENVYVIGTMNDIDRSVESMDFAIRRRFTWYEVKPDSKVLDSIENGKPMILEESDRVKARKRMDNLNGAIEKENLLGSAYAIGPAYFLKLDKVGGFDKLWELNLEPLLREYLRGNPKDEIKKKIEALKNAYEREEPSKGA